MTILVQPKLIFALLWCCRVATWTYFTDSPCYYKMTTAGRRKYIKLHQPGRIWLQEIACKQEWLPYHIPCSTSNNFSYAGFHFPMVALHSQLLIPQMLSSTHAFLQRNLMDFFSLLSVLQLLAWQVWGGALPSALPGHRCTPWQLLPATLGPAGVAGWGTRVTSSSHLDQAVSQPTPAAQPSQTAMAVRQGIKSRMGPHALTVSPDWLSEGVGNEDRTLLLAPKTFQQLISTP